MPLSTQAQLLYRKILAYRDRNPATVMTYGYLESVTGIEAIAQRVPLAEIFKACDSRRLPPLTAIVVQQNTSTSNGRYGMPGGGYFLEDDSSPNLARRNKDTDLTRRVRRHQDSVHDFSGSWPARL